jgi:hypothetical protein
MHKTATKYQDLFASNGRLVQGSKRSGNRAKKGTRNRVRRFRSFLFSKSPKVIGDRQCWGTLPQGLHQRQMNFSPLNSDTEPKGQPRRSDGFLRDGLMMDEELAPSSIQDLSKDSRCDRINGDSGIW